MHRNSTDSFVRPYTDWRTLSLFYLPFSKRCPNFIYLCDFFNIRLQFIEYINKIVAVTDRIRFLLKIKEEFNKSKTIDVTNRTSFPFTKTEFKSRTIDVTDWICFH